MTAIGAYALAPDQQARRDPGLWHAQRLTLSSSASSGGLVPQGFFAPGFWLSVLSGSGFRSGSVALFF
jgi:hypothetical protein